MEIIELSFLHFHQIFLIEAFFSHFHQKKILTSGFKISPDLGCKKGKKQNKIQ